MSIKKIRLIIIFSLLVIDLSATKIRYFSETSKLFPKIFAKKFYPEDLEKMRSIIFDICDGKQDSAKGDPTQQCEKGVGMQPL
jgi:hypothetical protein